jgi:dCTP deaminase
VILSDNDIKNCLSNGTLIIDPPRIYRIDTTSIDLRIGEPLYVWDPNVVR